MTLKRIYLSPWIKILSLRNRKNRIFMISYLQVEELTKSFGDLILLDEVNLGIAKGDKVGLIAKNGAGKTTFLNILAGLEPYDSGRITFRNDVRVGYLEQLPKYSEEMTVLDACFNIDSPVVSLIKQYEQALLENNADLISELIPKMDALEAWDYELQIKQILSMLKIDAIDQPMGLLSGGQIKRVALANLLIGNPDFIILDEPTNHLDLDMTEWLEDYLAKSTVTLLMVTHDRYFLERVCKSIIEIDECKIYRYEGNYQYYLEKRDERIRAAISEAEKAENLLRVELDWMRRQPQARGTKAKYRIDAFYDLKEKASYRRNEESLSLKNGGGYIGSKIFSLEHVNKAFDDLVILDDFNYEFARYEKMGIVGKNGTGKSTFVKLLLNEIEPDSGVIDIGQTVRFGYYSQEGLTFDEDERVIDIVKKRAEVIHREDGSSVTATQLLTQFLFPPEKQYNPVYKLSGGEKRRLYLCTILMTNPNFLILDEPTNDLDILTLNVLESYLQNFKGCVIVISHDRYFMDKVVDHLLVFKGQGSIQDFPGNYTQYRSWKIEHERYLAELEKEEQKDKAPVSNKPIRTNDKKKLSFKEKKEYEELTLLIEQLEAEQKEIENKLSDSASSSAEEMMSISQRYGEIKDLLEEKSMRWLELSEYV